MLGTVSVSVLAATLMDLIVPNFVYSWREKFKARYRKKRFSCHSRRKP